MGAPHIQSVLKDYSDEHAVGGMHRLHLPVTIGQNGFDLDCICKSGACA